jgi:glyoxylase-like metal-dependent hydrolase (beta-lactamase superfamily II)
MSIVVASAAGPPFMENGFLVTCGQTKEAVLIDPGDEVERLIEEARDSGANVRAVLLTHAHLDHISGVDRARAEFRVRAWLHPDDVFLYDAVVEQGEMFGLRVEPQAPVDGFYKIGTPVRFGHCVVDVLHTPGHSPGGVCLAIGEADYDGRELFVGDTQFAGSIGRTDLPGGDCDALIDSIRRVLFAFPDEAIVHPGHGPDTTIGHERRTNPFL